MRELRTVLVVVFVAALAGLALWMLVSPQSPTAEIVQQPQPPHTTSKKPTTPQPRPPKPRPGPEVPGPDLSKLGSISGRVVCQGGGVAEALVQALVGHEVVASARTDDKGNFTIKYLAAGTYRLTAKKSGYTEGSISGIRLTEAEQLSGVVIEIERGGSIEGQVVDEGGQPISGALIYAWLHTSGRVLKTFRTASDESGRFRLDGLPQGDYRLRATAKGFLDEHRIEETTVVADQTAEVNFMLRRGAAISGTVTDETGNPVHKARLTLAKTDGTALFAHTAFTDKNGSFCMTGLPEGTYKLKVWHKDYLPQDTGPYTLRPPDTLADVRIVLSTGVTLKGVVVDENGNPIKGVTVSATCSNPYLYRNTVTDKNGRFEIKGLYDAPVTVSAVLAGRQKFLPWMKRDLRPSTTPLRIVLTKGATLEGDIDADVPPRRYEILFYRLENGKKRFAKQAFLQGDTHFVVTGIKPGRYAVKARAAGYTDSPEEIVDLTSGHGYVRLTLRKK